MKRADKLRTLAIAAPASPKVPVSDKQNIWNGRVVSSDYGTYYAVDSLYPWNHSHGQVGLDQFLQADSGEVAFLAGDRELFGAPLAEFVFLDTETTGLNVGSGTLAFLIGLGWAEERGFVVRQFLIRDYPEESAVLHALQPVLAQACGLVTFNGKRFDWPLLKDRFMLNRVPLRRVSRLHLDLLYPARRLWRYRLPSCSLGQLEADILGWSRQDDIPGSEVPQRYFDFLTAGDPQLLVDVLAHNRWDILSLAALLGRLGQGFSLERTPYPSSYEAEALARLHFRSGNWSQTIANAEWGLAMEPPAEIRIRLLEHLAYGYKKTHRYAAARNVFAELVQERPGHAGALEELAKFYEHRCGDLQQALAYTRTGLQAVQEQQKPGRIQAFCHRQERLHKKLQRQSRTCRR